MKINRAKPLVSIIIVNFNGNKFLQPCLRSLTMQDYNNIEIILVDNGSTDGSVQYISKTFPYIKLIRLQKNIGFAGANNIGFKKATGKYVLLLNNDTKVRADFLSRLIEVFERDSTIGAAQSKLLVMDNPVLLDSVGAYLTPTGFLYHYGYAKKDGVFYDKEIPTYSAKGASMMVRMSALKKVLVKGNMFDPDYFAYFEETDLCHRIWLSGYKILYVPSSIVLHKMGATSSQMNNSFVQFHSFKNRINSYIKNLGGLSLTIILPLHLSICLLYAIVCVFSNNRSVAKSIVKAIVWNIIKLPDTLRKRLFIQHNIRKVSDRVLLPQIMKYPRLPYYYYMMVGVENYLDN